MPVRKVKGGYKYGNKGKVYKEKWKAERQGRAIRASQAREGKEVRQCPNDLKNTCLNKQ